METPSPFWWDSLSVSINNIDSKIGSDFYENDLLDINYR